MRILLVLIALLIFGCSSDNDDPNVRVYEKKAAPTTSTDYQDNNTCTDCEENVDEIPIDGVSTYDPDPSGVVRKSFTYMGSYNRYGTRNGGRPAWRIPGPMDRFGSICKFTFNGNGGFYYVYSQKANRANNGVVWKKGSHGGPYIHAPYRSNSTRVRIDCR